MNLIFIKKKLSIVIANLRESFKNTGEVLRTFDHCFFIKILIAHRKLRL